MTQPHLTKSTSTATEMYMSNSLTLASAMAIGTAVMIGT